MKKKILGLFMASTMLLGVTHGANAGTISEELKDVNLELGNELSLDKNIATKQVIDFANQSKSEIAKLKKEKKTFNLKNKEENVLYSYTLVDDEFIYSFETSEHSDAQNIKVFKNEYSEKKEADSIQPLAAANLPDGYGGRLKINSNGTSFTSSVYTPSSLQTDGLGTPYIYAGFSGKYETDLGLQYNTNRGANQNEVAWAPYMRISNGDTGTFYPGYNGVQFKNGFAPGVNVSTIIYANNNGKIRLKQQGYAICGDLNCSNTTDTYMVSIVDSKNTYNLGSSNINSWKVLGVLAGSETGKVKYTTDFNDIKIDNQVVQSSQFNTPDEEKATVTRTGNNVKIQVNGY